MTRVGREIKVRIQEKYIQDTKNIMYEIFPSVPQFDWL